jgi:hypothetical protein
MQYEFLPLNKKRGKDYAYIFPPVAKIGENTLLPFVSRIMKLF